eukprot:TRINITY_DN2032_c0_g2_i2.p1 TRINITY_DN2032_c0_g2~~TRINITY_DN2032_c0_g2_i2.p1  ORF type:complete len:428 (+),score=174.64 TRINITY_DN2032_c0_g2_i2:1010-2293(+)
MPKYAKVQVLGLFEGQGSEPFTKELAYPAASDWFAVPVANGTILFFDASDDQLLKYPIDLAPDTAYTIYAEGYPPQGRSAITALPAPAAAFVRIVNAAATLKPLDILVNDLIQTADFPSQATTGYVAYPADAACAIEFVATGTIRPVLAAINLTQLSPSVNETVIVFDPAPSGAATATVLADGNAVPANQASVRFVDAVNNLLPAVDVYLDGSVVVSSLGFATGSSYVDVPAGSHSLQLTSSGYKTWMFTQEVSFAAGTVHTAVFERNVSAGIVLQLLLDASAVIQPNTSSTSAVSTTAYPVGNATSSGPLASSGLSSGPSPAGTTGWVGTSGAQPNATSSTSGPLTTGIRPAATTGNSSALTTTTMRTTTTTTTGGNDDHPPKSQWNTTSIALVSAGCGLAVVFLIAVLIWLYRRHKANNEYELTY